MCWLRCAMGLFFPASSPTRCRACQYMPEPSPIQVPHIPNPCCSEEVGSAEELIAAGGAPVELPPPVLLAVLDRLLCLEVRGVLLCIRIKLSSNDGGTVQRRRRAVVRNC